MPMIDVLDSTMHYEDLGEGKPFVFLHGNPTSSHLWRNVLPTLGMPGRYLAPDLIGMGRSGKPDIPYKFADHARYLDAWFDKLGLEEVVLVGHDWGGTLAFDWAARHPERTRGIAFLETIIRPMPRDVFPEGHPFRSILQPGVGERMVLEENFFMEVALHRTVLNPLSDEDLEAYGAPYPTPESRRPLLEWPRAWPFEDERTDVVERIEAFGKWLATSDDVPKLLMTFDSSPTLVFDADTIEWCQSNVSGLEIKACGPAGHHAPEDQPQAIALAVAAWADRHQLR